MASPTSSSDEPTNYIDAACANWVTKHVCESDRRALPELVKRHPEAEKIIALYDKHLQSARAYEDKEEAACEEYRASQTSASRKKALEVEIKRLRDQCEDSLDLADYIEIYKLPFETWEDVVKHKGSMDQEALDQQLEGDMELQRLQEEREQGRRRRTGRARKPTAKVRAATGK